MRKGSLRNYVSDSIAVDHAFVHPIVTERLTEKLEALRAELVERQKLSQRKSEEVENRLRLEREIIVMQQAEQIRIAHATTVIAAQKLLIDQKDARFFPSLEPSETAISLKSQTQAIDAAQIKINKERQESLRAQEKAKSDILLIQQNRAAELRVELLQQQGMQNEITKTEGDLLAATRIQQEAERRIIQQEAQEEEVARNQVTLLQENQENVVVAQPSEEDLIEERRIAMAFLQKHLEAQELEREAQERHSQMEFEAQFEAMEAQPNPVIMENKKPEEPEFDEDLYAAAGAGESRKQARTNDDLKLARKLYEEELRQQQISYDLAALLDREGATGEFLSTNTSTSTPPDEDDNMSQALLQDPSTNWEKKKRSSVITNREMMKRLAPLFTGIMDIKFVKMSIAKASTSVDALIRAAQLHDNPQADAHIKSILLKYCSGMTAYASRHDALRDKNLIHNEIRFLAKDGYVSEEKAMKAFYPVFGTYCQDKESIAGKRTGEAHCAWLSGVRLHLELALIYSLKEIDLFNVDILNDYLAHHPIAEELMGKGFKAHRAKLLEKAQFAKAQKPFQLQSVLQPESAAAAQESLASEMVEVDQVLSAVNKLLNFVGDAITQCSSDKTKFNAVISCDLGVPIWSLLEDFFDVRGEEEREFFEELQKTLLYGGDYKKMDATLRTLGDKMKLLILEPTIVVEGISSDKHRRILKTISDGVDSVYAKWGMRAPVQQNSVAAASSSVAPTLAPNSAAAASTKELTPHEKRKAERMRGMKQCELDAEQAAQERREAAAAAKAAADAKKEEIAEAAKRAQEIAYQRELEIARQAHQETIGNKAAGAGKAKQKMPEVKEQQKPWKDRRRAAEQERKENEGNTKQQREKEEAQREADAMKGELKNKLELCQAILQFQKSWIAMQKDIKSMVSDQYADEKYRVMVQEMYEQQYAINNLQKELLKTLPQNFDAKFKARVDEILSPIVNKIFSIRNNSKLLGGEPIICQNGKLKQDIGSMFKERFYSLMFGCKAFENACNKNAMGQEVRDRQLDEYALLHKANYNRDEIFHEESIKAVTLLLGGLKSVVDKTIEHKMLVNREVREKFIESFSQIGQDTEADRRKKAKCQVRIDITDFNFFKDSAILLRSSSDPKTSEMFTKDSRQEFERSTRRIASLATNEESEKVIDVIPSLFKPISDQEQVLNLQFPDHATINNLRILKMSVLEDLVLSRRQQHVAYPMLSTLDLQYINLNFNINPEIAFGKEIVSLIDARNNFIFESNSVNLAKFLVKLGSFKELALDLAAFSVIEKMLFDISGIKKMESPRAPIPPKEINKICEICDNILCKLIDARIIEEIKRKTAEIQRIESRGIEAGTAEEIATITRYRHDILKSNEEVRLDLMFEAMELDKKFISAGPESLKGQNPFLATASFAKEANGKFLGDSVFYLDLRANIIKDLQDIDEPEKDKSLQQSVLIAKQKFQDFFQNEVFKIYKRFSTEIKNSLDALKRDFDRLASQDKKEKQEAFMMVKLLTEWTQIMANVGKYESRMISSRKAALLNPSFDAMLADFSQKSSSASPKPSSAESADESEEPKSLSPEIRKSQELCEAIANVYKQAVFLEQDIILYRMLHQLAQTGNFKALLTNYDSCATRVGSLYQKIRTAEGLREIVGSGVKYGALTSQDILEKLATEVMEEIPEHQQSSEKVGDLLGYVKRMEEYIFSGKIPNITTNITTRQNFYDLIEASKRFIYSCDQHQLLAVTQKNAFRKFVADVESKPELFPAKEDHPCASEPRLKFLTAALNISEADLAVCDSMKGRKNLIDALKNSQELCNKKQEESMEGRERWRAGLFEKRGTPFDSKFSKFAMDEGVNNFYDIHFMVIAMNVADILVAEELPQSKSASLTNFVEASKELFLCLSQGSKLLADAQHKSQVAAQSSSSAAAAPSSVASSVASSLSLPSVPVLAPSSSPQPASLASSSLVAESAARECRE